MAQAQVNEESNFKKIAYAAMGIDESSGPFALLYKYIDGELIVNRVTQQELDDAIKNYDHQAWLDEQANNEIDQKLQLTNDQVLQAVEVLVEKLFAKGIITQEELGVDIANVLQARRALRNNKK